MEQVRLENSSAAKNKGIGAVLDRVRGDSILIEIKNTNFHNSLPRELALWWASSSLEEGWVRESSEALGS